MEEGALGDGNHNADAKDPTQMVLHFRILLQMTGHQGTLLYFLFGQLLVKTGYCDLDSHSQSYGITEPSRLENTLKVIESNC